MAVSGWHMQTRARLIRFGIFEVNLDSGELRRRGVKVKLQEQPLQALLMLLERPGEVTKRDDLQKRLWPSETFGDFDRGLNRAINRLREALGDDADNPRFIETLPQRGYRFMAQRPRNPRGSRARPSCHPAPRPTPLYRLRCPKANQPRPAFAAPCNDAV